MRVGRFPCPLVHYEVLDYGKEHWQLAALAGLAIIAAGAIAFILLSGDQWLAEQRRNLDSDDVAAKSAAVQQIAVKLRSGAVDQGQQDTLLRLLRQQLGGPVDEQALASLVAQKDSETVPRIQALIGNADDATRVRYLLALTELPTDQARADFRPDHYADSLGKSRTAASSTAGGATL